MKNLTIKNFDNADELRDYFTKYGRGDQFTLEQFEILFDYLNECLTDKEIDVIELCCSFSGYDSIKDAVIDLGYDDPEDLAWNCCVLMGNDGSVLVTR